MHSRHEKHNVASPQDLVACMVVSRNKLSSLSNATDACVAVSGNKLSSLSKDPVACIVVSSNTLSSLPKDPEACIVVFSNKLSSLLKGHEACLSLVTYYRPSPRTLRYDIVVSGNISSSLPKGPEL